jgi:F0F1-type ATP synthase membrane subunit b/b'
MLPRCASRRSSSCSGYASAEVSAKEQERLVDRARRDVELQFRVARRELIQHIAELSMTLARARIEREMTADDQTELIDRYAAQVQS